MREQRKARRFDLKLPVELIRTGTQKTSQAGETKNVSSGGVLFRSAARMEVGDLIEYLITLPNSNHDDEAVRLRCLGKVIRLEEPVLIGNGDACGVAATLERYEFVRLEPVTKSSVA